ncbi:MAG: hypothetical protein C0594_18125 [Marinilabiliales bacterium]|mgnify:CR=1 FL=1|nr:MAG: hypothetical protein C0594_18125 [Marinilabiliales bacterium]
MESNILYLYAGIGSMVLLIVSGIILHKNGSPYNKIATALHKLFALAVIGFTILFVRTSFSFELLSMKQIIALSISLVSIMILFISGALLSVGRQSGGMLILHRLFTAGIIAGMTWFIYSFL